MLSIFAALFGGIALAAVTGVASSMAKSQDEQVKNDFNSFQKRKNEFISNMTNISLEREIENSLTRYKYSNKDDEYVRELRKTFGKYYDEPCLIDVPNISNTSYKRNVRVLLANRGYLYSTDLRFGIPVGRFNEYKCIRILNDEIVVPKGITDGVYVVITGTGSRPIPLSYYHGTTGDAYWSPCFCYNGRSVLT